MATTHQGPPGPLRMAQEIRDQLADLKANESVFAAELAHVREDIGELKENTRRIADAIGMIALQGEKVERLEHDVTELRERARQLDADMAALHRRVDRNSSFVKTAGAIALAAIGAIFAALVRWWDKGG